MAASAGKLRSLRIGDAVVSDLGVVILSSLPSLAKAIGTPLDGIVGHNFLKNFTVTIDYPRSVIAFERGANGAKRRALER
jgi:hypothetical protein